MTYSLHPIVSRKAREELAPRRFIGSSDGLPYVKRLQVYLERSWPIVEEAVRVAARRMHDNEERLVAVVAEELFHRGSEDVKEDGRKELADRQWREVEHKLVAIMSEKGLAIDLACARIGLDIKSLKIRCRDDPKMAERLELAFLRGTAKMHDVVWNMAEKGSDRAALALLQARDPRYVPTQKAEISEEQITRSGAWGRVLDRLIQAFSIVPSGGETEDYRRGWEDCRVTLRGRVVEEMSDG